MKKFLILIGVLVSLVAILIGLFFHLVFRIDEDMTHDINEYVQLVMQEEYLPQTDELGAYKDLEFDHLQRTYSIFQSDAYILRVTYDAQEFAKQKSLIDAHYTFQETVVDHGEETVERPAAFALDTFAFRMLSIKDYGLLYPKKMAWIAVSEETYEIAYVYYVNLDLDSMNGSFESFMKSDCGWPQ